MHMDWGWGDYCSKLPDSFLYLDLLYLSNEPAYLTILPLLINPFLAFCTFLLSSCPPNLWLSPLVFTSKGVFTSHLCPRRSKLLMWIKDREREREPYTLVCTQHSLAWNSRIMKSITAFQLISNYCCGHCWITIVSWRENEVQSQCKGNRSNCILSLKLGFLLALLSLSSPPFPSSLFSFLFFFLMAWLIWWTTSCPSKQTSEYILVQMVQNLIWEKVVWYY